METTILTGNLQSSAVLEVGPVGLPDFTVAEPVIHIRVMDKTGHSDFDFPLTESIDEIIRYCREQAMWAFINGQKFEFETGDLDSVQNKEKLRTTLQAVPEPSVNLTGRLVGGND